MIKSRINIKLLFVLILTGSLHLFISCESEKRDPPPDLPDEISFTNDVLGVFEMNCIQCHNGTVSPDLTSENAFFDLSSGNYLNTGAPEESYLYQKISGNGSMAVYADDYDRALILRWIEQGAQEN